MCSPPLGEGLGVLRETAMAVFADAQDRNRQQRLASSWLLGICVLFLGYVWVGAAGRPGYYVVAFVLFVTSGLFIYTAAIPTKYWALAAAVTQAYQENKNRPSYSALDANRFLLDVVTTEGEDGNPIKSVYRDTDRRGMCIKIGVALMMFGGFLIGFTEIATL